MQTLKPTRWRAIEPRDPAYEAARRIVGSALAGASAALGKLALSLTSSPALPEQRDPRLEFYADSGAPEGALYVDGKLVGWVAGITRL